jgi:hypothetical protein
LDVRADLGEEKIIAVNISSNPSPTRVTWSINGKPLEQGQSNEFFEAARQRQVGPTVVEVALKMKSVTEENLQKKIELRVENSLGIAEYDIYVQSSANGQGN